MPATHPTAAQAGFGLITSEGCRYIPFPTIPPFKLSFNTETKISSLQRLPDLVLSFCSSHPQGCRVPHVSVLFLLLYQVPMRLRQTNGWS